MALQQMQQEVYARQRVLEDEKHPRNSYRSIRPLRAGIFPGRNIRAPMETPCNKDISNGSKALGCQLWQKNTPLRRNASCKGERENTRRRSGVKGKRKKDMLLAGKGKQNRVQVLRSCRKKEHGKLPAL